MSTFLDPLLAVVTALNEDASVTEILEAHQAVKIHLDEAKRIKDLCEAILIEWMDAHGDLNVGNDIRYYVGTDTTVKCNNPRETVETLLAALDGDLGRFCETLASSPFKYGAVRDILPEAFDALFTTTVKKDLKTGKPLRKVKRTDDKFAR
jgi:hypothetical protein